MKAAAATISRLLSEPDDDFVRFFGKQIYDGTLTRTVLEVLRPAIQAALDEVVRTRIQERLNVTFGKDAPQVDGTEKKADATEAEPDVVTTADEQQAFMIIRAIGSRVVPVSRITMRDAKSYCSIFVDDNNRKPLCRLHFNSKNGRWIGLFDATKTETRQQIEDLSDIYKFADQIVETIKIHI